MQLSAGSGKISVRLLCSSGTVELNLFALPAVEKRVEMKEVLFLLVKNQQQLRRQLQGVWNIAFSFSLIMSNSCPAKTVSSR